MSGPKYSRAQLVDPVALKRILEQMQREIEVKKCEILKVSITRQVQENKSLFHDLNRADLILTSVRKNGDTNDSKKLATLLKEIRALSPIEKTEGNSDYLEKHLGLLRAQFSTARALRLQIDSTCEALVKTLTDRQQSHREQDFSQRVWAPTEETITLSDSRLASAVEEALRAFMNSDDYQLISNKLDEIANDTNTSVDTKLEQIENYVQAVKVESIYKKTRECSQSDIIEFKSLCQLLNIERALPSNASDLALQINVLKEELNNKRKQQYVTHVASEVLQEIGYELLETDNTLMPSANNAKKLYFDLSCDSVLNLTASPNGALMFEVQGRQRGDGMTQQQRDRVVADMEQFCPDYQIIRTKLKERGIILDNEQLFPPLEKYIRLCNQRFVNTEDEQQANISHRRLSDA